tara:strand:- start:881 stop:2023 length:1143 start_codon:yes stop_codon:yes gene_type:complete
MATVYSKDGSTYTTGGITYDASSGRPITSDGGFLLDKENKTFASTNKETSNNNNADGHKTKLFTYPVARKNDSETDYFMMEIAEYQAPGLDLPAFTVDKNDAGEKIGISNLKPNEKTGTFALKEGSNTQAFTGSLEEKNKKIKAIICLPMPRNITDSQGVQYGESSLNPIEAVGLAGASEIIQGNVDRLKSAFNATLQAGNDAFKDPNTQTTIATALSGTAIGALGGNVNVNQLISRSTGQVLNPNLELLFQGVGIRNFPFQFQFFPRNPHEGKTVMNIIRKLKTEMAPRRSSKEGTNSGVFIRTPSVFQLTYMKGSEKHPFLNSFLPAVLSDMKVNYSASGAHSTFYDGTPTHIRMDLQFKELNPIFAEDYDNVEGVGY